MSHLRKFMEAITLGYWIGMGILFLILWFKILFCPYEVVPVIDRYNERTTELAMHILFITLTFYFLFLADNSWAGRIRKWAARKGEER